MEVIKEVLTATSCYDALGIDAEHSELSDADVRRAYLKRSVKVHPDKHAPDVQAEATRAFQKVSSSYERLKTAHARTQYDADCRNGHADDDCGGGGGGGGGGDDAGDGGGGGAGPRKNYGFAEAAAVFAAAFAAERAATAIGGVGGACSIEIMQMVHEAEFLCSPAAQERLREGDAAATIAAASTAFRAASLLGRGLSKIGPKAGKAMGAVGAVGVAASVVVGGAALAVDVYSRQRQPGAEEQSAPPPETKEEGGVLGHGRA